jgi:hypothetical protein
VLGLHDEERNKPKRFGGSQNRSADSVFIELYTSLDARIFLLKRFSEIVAGKKIQGLFLGRHLGGRKW